MAGFREQIEEIKALLSSENKALAYLKLLHLQEISAAESAAVGTLADSSHAILSSAVSDIVDNDEEIAAQALKCLGFMIYHPTIVASIGGDDAHVIVESVVKVITTTKIKSVCNLGVWCISIQQLSSSLLDQHFQSLLRAVTHALDNPIGSLSITFEAMQAVVKLAGSLTEQMRNMSSLWTPPIYSRLVSVDKRDRDMSERCLLKIMSLICPPPVTLSKALAVDMKKKLLSAMKELSTRGMKIQSLQAWGWFIRLLGPYAIKNKHLINEMLKIMEQKFSDFDSQVQIAALVAWEGLIDALIDSEAQVSLISFMVGRDAQMSMISESDKTQNEADRHLKRIKLIMAPLVGMMSGKCDPSVHASCLTTWSYLLHKLGASVNCQSLLNTVWEPILELVFQVGPDIKNIWLWNFCLELLDSLILGRNQGTIGNLKSQETNQSALKNAIGGHLAFGEHPLRRYPIDCSPMNLCQLDFFIKMISSIVGRESNATVAREFRRFACNAALTLFGSLLETVQSAIHCVSITYEEIMQCLNILFGFLDKLCEKVTSEDDSDTCLKFLKAVIERLEPSILESPLYKVGLDIRYIKKVKHANEVRCETVPGICFMNFEDKVLPVVLLSTLYYSVVVNSTLKAPQYESLLQQMQGYLKFLLSSYNPQDVLHAFTCLLYRHTAFSSLQIWVVLVNCLKECIDGRKDQVILKMETDSIGYSIVLHLLSYPFASWSIFQIQLELQIVVEVWEWLYVSVDLDSQSVHSAKSLSEDLCAMLNGCIDQTTIAVDTGIELLKEKECSGRFVLLFGNIIICVLKQLAQNIISKGRHCIARDGRKSNIMNSIALAAREEIIDQTTIAVDTGIELLKEKECSGRFVLLFGNIIICVLKQLAQNIISKGRHCIARDGRKSNIMNSIALAARFMKLFWANKERTEPSHLSVASRFLSELVNLVGCLQQKEDVLVLIETISSPLLEWLRHMHLLDEKTNFQLQLLWSEILKSLQRCQPSIKFDSSFLKFQEPLLERALDHPSPAISEATINFWNSTYGAQKKLEFPTNLVPILDKLYRKGKVNICSRNHCIEDTISSLQGYKVTNTVKKCSKRVEIVGNPVHGLQHIDNVYLGSKRKRPELTEHQKEVRRAQQGRSRDCNGRGPGIRTYTSVDFSQGNEE